MKYWRVPLDLETIEITRGRVTVIKERCKGCQLCVTYCPRNVLRMSQTFNSKGYYYPEPEGEADCVNCHFCEVLCPDFAIFSLEASPKNQAQ
jgi:2-oxoglutarate ferredoxin oxidoreductase subunit delta